MDVGGAISGGGRRATKVATAAKDDPWRAGRAVTTGGISEAYKSATDPSKKDMGAAEEAQKEAERGAIESRKGIAEQMKGSDTDYLNQMKGQTSDYERQRNLGQEAANKADDTYSNSLAGAEDKYQQTVAKLSSEAENQAKDAKATYSNTILPGLKESMEDAQRNSRQAMSLSEAGDMNNAVQKGVRNFYEQQAVGEGRQGLADVGVLQAMGAQALQGQMGAGAPMSGAQLQLATAQNMQQGGQAFSNTQKRIQNLRQQGIEQGISQSGQQYERGERARDRSREAIGAFEGAGNRMNREQAGFRGEIGGYGSETRGSQRTRAGDIYGGQMSQLNRGQAGLREHYNLGTGISGLQYRQSQNQGLQQQDIANMQYGIASGQAGRQMAAASAQNQAQNAMFGGGIQAAATGIGAMAGGPAGAQTGNAIGGSFSSGLSRQQGAPMQAPAAGSSYGNDQVAQAPIGRQMAGDDEEYNNRQPGSAWRTA